MPKYFLLVKTELLMSPSKKKRESLYQFPEYPFRSVPLFTNTYSVLHRRLEHTILHFLNT